MVQLVAEQVQRHDRVHPRRLDTAPAAIALLPGDDPVRAPPQRRPPHRLHRPVPVQYLVERGEGAGPWIGCRLVRGDAGTEFIDAEVEGAGRAERLDDGEGDDGLAGPAAPVVDVER